MLKPVKSTVAFVVLAAAAAAASADTIEAGREWRFRALLDGRDIGRHTFRLEREGGELVLSSEAGFEVKFLFFTAYRYEHSATERWSGDCLRSVRARTNDNDTRYAVDGQLEGGAFVLRTGEGQRPLAPCIMTFAYWNPAILEQRRLLNVQTGDYVDVTVQSDGPETISVAGTPVESNRYTLRADGLAIRLWYAKRGGAWLMLESDTKEGYTLRYELESPLREAASGEAESG